MKVLSILLIVLYLGNVPSFKAEKNDICYVGVENIFPIALNGNLGEDIEVKTNPGFGSFYKKDDSTYSFVPQLETAELKIKLYFKKVLCEVKTIKIIKMPQPEIYVEGEKNNSFSEKNLSALSQLSLIYPNNSASGDGKIYSFNIQINDHLGNFIYNNNIMGDKMDFPTQKIIERLKKGSTIIINNVITYSLSKGHQQLQINKGLTIGD